MTIFRLENKEGKGPYTNVGGKIRPELHMAHVDDYDHPSALGDFNKTIDDWRKSCRAIQDGWLCGFQTLQELKDWFGDFLPRLIKYDQMLIRQIEIEDGGVLIGGKQVLFNPSMVLQDQIVTA